ncbi:hypothetical protein [Parasphingorhabdus marina]|uniref:hypothetical protein n=1 Tax=Parasphingorhabdus marina TaxID=394732 RepID=UPI0011614885|nr:hypothetical protein [Parasphingorhabdus marina]
MSNKELVIVERTKSLSGWFDSRGEWTLFPNKNFSSYDPYTQHENKKCVSLINGTNQPRDFWRKFDRKQVAIEGNVVPYDALQTGQTDADRLLARKYYGSQVVHNFCLRDYVFVVTAIKKVK